MATLFILPNLRIGGAEKVTLQLAKALVSSRSDVGIALLSSEGELLSDVPSNIQIHNLKCARLYMLFRILPLFLSQNKKYTSVVCCCWTITVVSAIALLFDRSTKIICWQHGYPSVKSNPKNLLFYLLVPLCYHRIHYVVSVSQRLKNLLCALLPYKRKCILVFANPLLLPVYTSETVALKKCSNAIVWSGRFEPEKDPLFMIHSFHLIAEAYPSYNLVMLGEGTLLRSARLLADRNSFSHRISLCGYVKDPFIYYRHASLLALTSRTEGQPSVIPEAMSAGLKVVSTPCSDQIITMLRNDPFSYISPTWSISDFALTLGRAIDAGPRSCLPAKILSAYEPSYVAENWYSILT